MLTVIQNTVESSPLLVRVRDACRFVQYHKFEIEGFPLQVYASALAFSTSSSITRQQFESEMVEFIVRKPATEEDWSACLQILQGHTASVNSAAWSPDGVRISSASSDRLVKIWDSVTGQCILTIKGHSDEVKSVAWSPDGTQIVSASKDNTVRTWDSMTGECLSLLQEHEDSVESVSWSYDGAYLASGSQDRIIKIWDSATGQCISTLTGYDYRHSTVVFSWSPTSRMLIDGYGKIWNVETGKCISTLGSDSGYAMSVNWSVDGIKIATILQKPQGRPIFSLSIWSSATGQCLSTLPWSPGSSNIFWSRSSARLAMVLEDRDITLWDVATGQHVSTVGAHEGVIKSIAWSHDGVRLASGSADNTVKVWQPASTNSPALDSQYYSNTHLVELSLDGTQLTSISYKFRGTINILDIATGQYRWIRTGYDSTDGLAWSSAGTWLASYDLHTIMIWDIALGQCAQTLRVDADCIILKVAWTLDESQRRLVSASYDCVRIWDTVTGHCSSAITDFNQESLLAWAPDGTQLAIATECRIRIWAIETKEWIFDQNDSKDIIRTKKFIFDEDDNDIIQLIWSRDGTRVLSSSRNGMVRIWDIIAGQCLSAFSISISGLQSFDSSVRDSLHTDLGAFDVQWLVAAADSSHKREQSDLVPVGYGLDSNKTWITYNGERLLLIPPEYRPPIHLKSFSRIFGSAVTICTLSGRALRLEFPEGGPFHKVIRSSNRRYE
jgi:WD40 repeat protein